MKFSFENLGPIKNGSIKIRDINIICGGNNTGKTYTAYMVFSTLYLLRDFGVLPTDKALTNEFFDFWALYTPEDIFPGFNKLLKNKRLLNQLINKSIEQNTAKLKEMLSGSEDGMNKLSVKLTELEARLPESFKIADRYMQIEWDSDLEWLTIEINDAARENIPPALIKKRILNVFSDKFLLGNLPRPFPITAERTGVSVFYKELDSNRTQIIDYINKNKKININEMLSLCTSKYANPIQSNIDVTREGVLLAKQRKSRISKNTDVFKLLLAAWQKVLEGEFLYLEETAFFKCGENTADISYSSSHAKALILLDLYIRHFAQENDLLIIDEPELNLHPDKQILLCHALALLTKLGVKLLITTHSDYVVREFNLLIKLSSASTSATEILSEHGYTSDLALSPKNVSCNVTERLLDTEGIALKSIPVGKAGFSILSIDSVIDRQNEIGDIMGL